MSADNSSLLPPPNGSSMAIQVNARTHSEPFMATKSFHIPPPQTFYMLMKSFHIPPGPSMAMKYFHISGSPPPHTHTLPGPSMVLSHPLHIIIAVSYNGPPDHFWTSPCISLQCHNYRAEARLTVSVPKRSQ